MGGGATDGGPDSAGADSVGTDGTGTDGTGTDGTGTDGTDGGPVDTTVPPEALSEAPTSASEGLHVALTGSDETGDGSAAKPYQHVQYVLDTASVDGSVVLIHEGTYSEQVRIRHNGVTLQSAPGEHAHLSCVVSLDENDPPLCVEIDAETTGVTLRSLEISGGFYAVFLGSQWDYDDTPTDNLAANHVLIEDCVIHDTGRDSVKLPAGCDDVTIRRCEIYGSGKGYAEGTPLDDKNAEGIDVVNSDRVHIADTYIHDTATTCVYVKGGSIGAVIERVRAERCGGLGIALGFDTSPEFFDTTVNPKYYENIGGTVRNSVVIDTGLAGIALYASKDAHVLHNTIIRAGAVGQAGLFLGIATQDYDPIGGRPPNDNPTIVGNIVDQSGLAAPACASIRYTDEDGIGKVSALGESFTIRDNLYFAVGAPCTFNDVRPNALLEDGDLAAWQAHGVGFDVGSTFADPMLDSTGHLSDGSPAVDKLSATAGVTYDIDSAERVALYDLGADER